MFGQFAQPVGIGAVRRADHEDHVDKLGEFLDGILAVLRRITDVFLMRPFDAWESTVQSRHNIPALIDAERSLRHIREMLVVFHLQFLHVAHG